MTRICIFGAGAIGGFIGARLAKAGEADVSPLVARGAHLEAMKMHGLKLTEAGEDYVVHPRVTADPRELGPQDFILLTLKTYALPNVVDALQPLIGPHTAVLFGQNGLPWWYFYKHGGRFDGRRLQSVDPGGGLWKLGPERALGCVIWQAAEIVRPGHIVHVYGERMPMGEPSGEITDRVTALSELLIKAGIKSPVKANLRDEMWLKLWGNLSFNPVSVLTNGTLVDLARDTSARSVLRVMMLEAQAVGEALGVSFPMDVEERMDMATRVGAHRTSMLQDVDAGRPVELDALLGVVIELAQMTGIATPALKLVYDLVRFRARVA